MPAHPPVGVLFTPFADPSVVPSVSPIVGISGAGLGTTPSS